ncbi:B-cell scaffold protein with ankyrin repeats [Protopterus annectens]|uniref:B-cell scaffold protein with ankyrin repeats n=1 Tax=Protopterus annectens TaxID=7888 RepID=UPI001CF99050|nr:B-cell scaffold protein with ankyrin repeats [Protopterus annectens]
MPLVRGHTEGSEVTTSDETQLKPDNEDIFLPSGDSNSPVLVIPKRLQCENPGEIFILIRDQGIEAHMMEVEFSSNKEQIRIQPSVWSDQVLYMKALDFAAGIVNVKVYSEGIMKYTTDIEYYTAMGEIVRLLNKVTDPIAFMCQALQISSKEKLDELLTFSLKSKMEPGGYDFSENDKSDYRRDNLHSGDLPTLLHFAAKYGLTQLVSLLMKCPGAVQASQITNKRGENPINLASSYGYNDVKKLLEELSVSEVSPDKEDQSVPFTGKAQVSSPQAEASKYSQDEEDDVYIIMTENPPKFLQEGEKNLKQEGKKTEIPDIEEIEREQDEMVEEEEEEDPYSIADSDDVYDMIISSDVKRKSSFIPNRPPAPTPRPPPATPVGIKEVNTPYIAQVFQQKSTHPQAGIDKLYTAVSKPGAKPTEYSTDYDTVTYHVGSGQEELIWLQEKVKMGEMTMDEALSKFEEWQAEQRKLDYLQKDKLHQLRCSIIGDRPEEDKLYDKLSIVHHPIDIREGAKGGPIKEETMQSNAYRRHLPPHLNPAERVSGIYARPHK